MTPADNDHRSPCFYCDGAGTVECTTCSGRGGRNAHRYAPTGFDHRRVEGRFAWETCSPCEGTGRVDCPECLGSA